jgi:hypothetical protein
MILEKQARLGQVYVCQFLVKKVKADIFPSGTTHRTKHSATITESTEHQQSDIDAGTAKC